MEQLSNHAAKDIRRMIAFLLSFAMLITSVTLPQNTFRVEAANTNYLTFPAEEAMESEYPEYHFTWVNPIYEDVVDMSALEKGSQYDKTDILKAGSSYSVNKNSLEGTSFLKRYQAAYSDYKETPEEAAVYLRSGLKKRQERIEVYFKTSKSVYDDDMGDYIENMSNKIGEIALAHTGVPTEGDYSSILVNKNDLMELLI